MLLNHRDPGEPSCNDSGNHSLVHLDASSAAFAAFVRQPRASVLRRVARHRSLLAVDQGMVRFLWAITALTLFASACSSSSKGPIGKEEVEVGDVADEGGIPTEVLDSEAREDAVVGDVTEGRLPDEHADVLSEVDLFDQVGQDSAGDAVSDQDDTASTDLAPETEDGGLETGETDGAGDAADVDAGDSDTTPGCLDTEDCADDDPCTVDDCVDSVCVHSPKQCPGQGNCLVWQCNPNSGMCDPVPAPDQTACSDGDACTDGDACKGGLCVGVEVDCDDNDPCTSDFCDSTIGCLQAPEVEVCFDGIDNDCDGKIDCADVNCFGPPFCGKELLCSDGADNDLDKAADCLDSDCFSPLCQEVCFDGKDHDADGLVGCQDPDCFGVGCPENCHPSSGVDADGDGLVGCQDPDCFSPSCPEVCSGGLDEDSDGKVDCTDPDCFGKLGCQKELLCNDNQDNDDDGLLDCSDPDCFSQACPEVCNDAQDNDGDGKVDCADPDCPAGMGICETSETSCTDGFDNDGDGKTDCVDSDCSTNPGCGAEVCDDGFDNDGDGKVDCADSDCAQAQWCGPEQCTDGKDNDGDGLTDCKDPDCFGPTCPEVCAGGLDEDGDGKKDCADSDCFGKTGCKVETLCGDGQDNDADGKVDCADSDCFSPSCTEICNDGFDNDADGKIDCADPNCFGGGCPESCKDGLDNDGDGKVDCADPDCYGSLCPELCKDGIDNDGDGKIDCLDPDCYTSACPELCTGGKDEDGDGLIDCLDPDCWGPGCPEVCNSIYDEDLDGKIGCADPDCFSPACPELCAGGADEDKDGKVDCADPDCFGKSGCKVEGLCQDGLDNDLDGKIDCADPDCFGKLGCTVEKLCSDGLDNDADGKPDCADPDCFGVGCPENCSSGSDEDGDGKVGCDDPDCWGPACPEVCVGGKDEDADGLIDCKDPDCYGSACPELCTGGIDEDGDGKIDCKDPDCFGPTCPEVCTGGLDEDGDGLIDCKDPDCTAQPACGEICDNGKDDDGDGLVDCKDPNCFGPTCPEVCTGGLDEDGDGLVDCKDPNCFGPACPEVCTGGLDEDGDGKVDCADSNCAQAPECQEICNNGKDDDADGLVDCKDPDCFGSNCPEVCTGGLDEDGDSLVDCKDPNCFGPTCPEVCTGGLDEDGDGLVDCKDPNCFGSACPEVCTGGLDEDGDGKIDCADPDCSQAPGCQEICDNGKDDDGDGFVDCNDPSCSNFPSCSGDKCSNPLSVPDSASLTFEIEGFANDTIGTCGGLGPDLILQLTVGATSDLHVDTEGSDVDTVVYLRSGNCETGPQLACGDDVGTRKWSRIEVAGLAPGTYFVIVDTASGTTSGKVEVHLELTPPLGPHPTVHDDPLVRMPGTQGTDGVVLEEPNRCLNCHFGYDQAVEPGFNWIGSMMGQAARDPLFYACLTVAIQDSYWAIGSPNAGDLCMRCHFPAGWAAGRSAPPNGSAMTGGDFDGVTCDACHRQFDPFFDATYSGTREGSDWLNYWDETEKSATKSSVAAQTTWQADILSALYLDLFSGTAFYGNDNSPVLKTWTEASSGQYFFDQNNVKRASFADANATHKMYYSRFHKSRYTCATCHDVSNPALANISYASAKPGDGATVLPSESSPPSAYFHVERTFSEFMLSAFGQQGGAQGSGAFAPDKFKTSLPGNQIARCQDCHMRDGVGAGCDKKNVPIRPTDSVEHPMSGQPIHDMTGGNALIGHILASTVTGSPNYDATNAQLLKQGANVLTLNLAQGEPLNPAALLNAVQRALLQLQMAATIEGIKYTPNTGALEFIVRNDTGHKLISGFPEGRRMFVNIKLFSGQTLLHEVNPYDAQASTLKGLPPKLSPSSPPLGQKESHVDALVYEVNPSSSLTGEQKTFHFVLATGRYKDNRIPPKGFDIQKATQRLAEPVWNGESAPGYFTAEEYQGGYDHVSLTLPTGGNKVEIRLYYQTTSREYIEFLRDEILGTANTLPVPSPAGSALSYIAQTHPTFAKLKAWGQTIWDLWLHNRNVPGAAPVLMTQGILTL